MSMNVSYSNDVTNTIKELRENIYCTDEFKDVFSDNLKYNIKAKDTSYIPDQFGGWSVNVTTDETTSGNDSIQYVRSIADALATSVHQVDKSISCRNLAANLSNIIITGPASIVVKI